MRADISWNSVSGAEYYKLQKNDIITATIDAQTNTYLDTLLVTGTHSYRISACNASGCSTFSNSFNIHTLTITNPINGSITGATSRAYNAGQTITLIATPDNHYMVSSWTGDFASCGSSSDCTITMNRDKEGSVNFVFKQYTLTITDPSNGSITEAMSGVYNVGQTITLTASPDNNYIVDSWTGDFASCGSTSDCTIVINGDKEGSVNFILKQYTLTIINPSNGSIIGATSRVYNVGQTITLTANPNSNYAVSS